MEYVERYIVELEDGTFALWGQFEKGGEHSILPMKDFYNATLFRKEHAELKVVQINKGEWLYYGDEPKKAVGIRKIEMKIV
ncbi:hypothetical protein RB620_21475 [Paenibacillus sp. LHD-117]|uniref:hypothetical protein n=1 Tax=Paenibacillus sp. LHD-117 TaxID=3071412 RepID=UPI0027DF0F28|nr:hypothetical protein [Paenibacillus sp. LHD-117]MDQ6422004.1 hypothetical protein [Paenibacillus sp. LHD-117]